MAPKYVRKTAEQLATLEQAWKGAPRIRGPELEALIEETGLTKTQILRWYTVKRSAQKAMARAPDLDKEDGIEGPDDEVDPSSEPDLGSQDPLPAEQEEEGEEEEEVEDEGKLDKEEGQEEIGEGEEEEEEEQSEEAEPTKCTSCKSKKDLKMCGHSKWQLPIEGGACEYCVEMCCKRHRKECCCKKLALEMLMVDAECAGHMCPGCAEVQCWQCRGYICLPCREMGGAIPFGTERPLRVAKGAPSKEEQRIICYDCSADMDARTSPKGPPNMSQSGGNLEFPQSKLPKCSICTEQVDIGDYITALTDLKDKEKERKRHKWVHTCCWMFKFGDAKPCCHFRGDDESENETNRAVNVLAKQVKQGSVSFMEKKFQWKWKDYKPKKYWKKIPYPYRRR